MKHIVYKLIFNRRKNLKAYPYYYIGSKSNCTVINNVIIDKKGLPYYGSSKFPGYKEIVETEKQFITVEVIKICNTYQEALEEEHNIHKSLKVVLSPEFFNLQEATKNTFCDPGLKLVKCKLSNKHIRVPITNNEDTLVGITSGKKWFNDGCSNRLLDPFDVPTGWIKGRVNCKNSPENFFKRDKSETIRKMVNTRKSRGNYRAHNKGVIGIVKMSDTTKEKMRLSSNNAGAKNGMFGKKFINNGFTNRTIYSNESLPEGWSFGKIMTKQLK